MGCDAADLVTAIISLSGVTYLDPSKCKPSHPVSVLQIHGTADDTVPFGGSPKLFPGASPGARATYDTWAAKNGCTGDDVVGPTIDFDKNVAGAETTTVRKAVSGSCAAATELWTVTGGGHAMNIATSTKQFFLDWLLATPPNHP
jgi:polyhydroxybutyrate depolymerase